MLTLVGRSSSHFTRVTRMFAAELGVAYAFEVVADLRSLEAADYAGNPALRLPILKSPRGVWFGALNICRELTRLAPVPPGVVWPEHLEQPLLANAQELTLQAMATEVALIMAQASGLEANDPALEKQRTSLANLTRWLDQHVVDVLAALPPERDLSFLEVALFCYVTHLEFRGVLSMADYAQLNDFCGAYGQRAAALGTPYRFDV
jgi:glutathione S-transferase